MPVSTCSIYTQRFKADEALGLPPKRRRGLATINLIETLVAGVRPRTHRVRNWRNRQMDLRRGAAAYLDTGRNFRRIIGQQDLWVFKAVLDTEVPQLQTKDS